MQLRNNRNSLFHGRPLKPSLLSLSARISRMTPFSALEFEIYSFMVLV
jgi:hypothetical protein